MTPRDRLRLGGRSAAMLHWLQGRADTGIGRLALLWFRRYFEASRNSGAAATAYVTVSIVPAALVFVAIFDLGGSANAMAERIIAHLDLHGPTADVVRQTFGSTSDNLLAATVTIVIGFLIWGIGIGQVYRDVYARAWRIQVGSAADQVLYTIWFFVTSILAGLMVVATSELRDNGWAMLVPAWLAASTGYWLLTPRFLLHRKIPLRGLLPGALLASFAIGGTVATAPLWIGPTLTQNAKAFGSFGVVVALVAYLLIWITISMVCAVFSPVWAEWRQSERGRSRKTSTAPVRASSPVPREGAKL